jgi:hypothetical protein
LGQSALKRLSFPINDVAQCPFNAYFALLASAILLQLRREGRVQRSGVQQGRDQGGPGGHQGRVQGGTARRTHPDRQLRRSV